MARKIILHCRLSPGDVLTLTAAIESLHAGYAGQYMTDVRTTVPEIWQHNPHITALQDEEAEAVNLDYSIIHRSDQLLIPFLAGYTRDLGKHLRIPLELTTNRPHLYLSDEEKGWINQIRQHFTHGHD